MVFDEYFVFYNFFAIFKNYFDFLMKIKNHIFCTLPKCILVIPMKLSRDIAWGKGHLVHEFDLKRP